MVLGEALGLKEITSFALFLIAIFLGTYTYLRASAEGTVRHLNIWQLQQIREMLGL